MGQRTSESRDTPVQRDYIRISSISQTPTRSYYGTIHYLAWRCIHTENCMSTGIPSHATLHGALLTCTRQKHGYTVVPTAQCIGESIRVFVLYFIPNLSLRKIETRELRTRKLPATLPEASRTHASRPGLASERVNFAVPRRRGNAGGGGWLTRSLVLTPLYVSVHLYSRYSHGSAVWP